MKKRVLAVLAFLLIPLALFGAVTATHSVQQLQGTDIFVYELDCTGTTGTVTTTTAINGLVYLVETDPGSPAPADQYDLTLTNSNGIDVMGGALANRSTSSTERVFPKIGTTDAVVPVQGKLTLNVTNQGTSGARFKVRIYFMK